MSAPGAALLVTTALVGMGSAQADGATSTLQRVMGSRVRYLMGRSAV
jgi:hypothetical protein